MSSSNSALDIIRNKAEAAKTASANLAIAEAENAVASEKILQDISSLRTEIGRNQVIVTQTLQAGNMKAQQAASQAVDAAGGYNALYALIERSAKTTEEVAKLTEQVRSDQEVSWFSDPARRLRIMLDADKTYNRLDSGIEQLQTLQALSNNLTNKLSAVGNIARANAQTITSASIEASTSIVEKEAAIQAHLARLDGWKYNTMGVQAVAAATDRELSLATTVANMARQEAQFQLSLEEEQRRREQFSWEKEKFRALREEKLEEKGFEDRTIARINLGEIARGLNPSTPQMIRDMIKLNKGLSQEYTDLYRNGEIAERTGQAIIAESPGKVAAVFSRDPSLISKLNANQKKAAEVIMNASKVLRNSDGTLKPEFQDDKTGAKSMQAVTAATQAAIARQLSYVGNDPDNVFYIGEPSSFIGTKDQPGVPAFQKYALIKKVFEPAINDGNSLSDVSVPYKLSLEAVKRGEISSVQAAADFSNIYKRMSALHRAGVDFRKFAISLPPDGATYRVKIDGEIIDVTDFVSVAQAMNRSLARQAFEAQPAVKRLVPPALDVIPGGMR